MKLVNIPLMFGTLHNNVDNKDRYHGTMKRFFTGIKKQGVEHLENLNVVNQREATSLPGYVHATFTHEGHIGVISVGEWSDLDSKRFDNLSARGFVYKALANEDRKLIKEFSLSLTPESLFEFAAEGFLECIEQHDNSETRAYG